MPTPMQSVERDLDSMYQPLFNAKGNSVDSNDYASCDTELALDYLLRDGTCARRAGNQADSGSNAGEDGEDEKKTSFWPLVLLIFLSVSAGPFGVEPAVAAGGPFIALLGFVVLPLVWSIPEALVTAELSTTFPENAGCVVWVSTAYGPFWGWMEGYSNWVSGVADNSLYPVLFFGYLPSLLPEDSWLRDEGLRRWGCVVCVNVILCCLIYRGLRIIGRVAIAMALFSLLPFMIFVLWGLPQCTTPTSWLSPPDGGWGSIRWGTFLNVMFWKLNYFDKTFPVLDPGNTYPRALLACVTLVVLSYALPVLVGTGSASVSAVAAAAESGIGDGLGASEREKGRWSLWVDGYFAVAAEAIAGRWLTVWIVLASAAANIGHYQSAMTSDALQVMGMAERGMLPAVFAKPGTSGISGAAITASGIGVIALGMLGFQDIVSILNVLYCFAGFLKFMAFVQLRTHHRDLQRPFEIPVGTVAVCAILFPSLCFIVVIAISSSVKTWAVSGSMLLFGLGLYPGLRLAKHREWFEFRDLTLYEGDIARPENSALSGA